MDMEDEEMYKTLIRVLKYIKYTKEYGIKLEIIDTEIWTIKCYSETDWGGDKENHKSITGWRIYLNGNLISWGSKKQLQHHLQKPNIS